MRRRCFAPTPNSATSSLRRGRVRMTVQPFPCRRCYAPAPNFMTSSLSRGRVRILRDFRKHASKISSMLTLPARTLPTRKKKAAQKTARHISLSYFTILFCISPCSFVRFRVLMYFVVVFALVPYHHSLL